MISTLILFLMSDCDGDGFSPEEDCDDLDASLTDDCDEDGFPRRSRL